MEKRVPSQSAFARRVFEGLTMLVVLALGAPAQAHAYIDAGSGALIWQAVVTALFAASLYLRRITRYLKSRFGKGEKPPEANQSEANANE